MGKNQQNQKNKNDTPQKRPQNSLILTLNAFNEQLTDEVSAFKNGQKRFVEFAKNQRDILALEGVNILSYLQAEVLFFRARNSAVTYADKLAEAQERLNYVKQILSEISGRDLSIVGTKLLIEEKVELKSASLFDENDKNFASSYRKENKEKNDVYKNQIVKSVNKNLDEINKILSSISGEDYAEDENKHSDLDVEAGGSKNHTSDFNALDLEPKKDKKENEDELDEDFSKFEELISNYDSKPKVGDYLTDKKFDNESAPEFGESGHKKFENSESECRKIFENDEKFENSESHKIFEDDTENIENLAKETDGVHPFYAESLKENDVLKDNASINSKTGENSKNPTVEENAFEQRSETQFGDVGVSEESEEELEIKNVFSIKNGKINLLASENAGLIYGIYKNETFNEAFNLLLDVSYCFPLSVTTLPEEAISELKNNEINVEINNQNLSISTFNYLIKFASVCILEKYQKDHNSKNLLDFCKWVKSNI